MFGVVVAGAFAALEFDPSFVNESGGLEGLAGFLLSQFACSETTKFFVDFGELGVRALGGVHKESGLTGLALKFSFLNDLFDVAQEGKFTYRFGKRDCELLAVGVPVPNKAAISV